MKKILCLLFLAFILSGCATYKFQKPDNFAVGYLAYYDGIPVAEYTVGREKTLPDLNLAKERFKRRRPTVERYCKQMGQIESRLKEFFWEPPAMIVGFLGGVIRWPFIAVADYKYNHNPEYKINMDKLDEEKEALETARINNLRKQLNAYIAQDLAEESGGPNVVETALAEAKSESKTSLSISEEKVRVQQPVVVSEPVAIKPELLPIVESVALPALAPAKIKPAATKKAPIVKRELAPPVAVITAKPVKGYSPLKVNFSGQKSSSGLGRIVAYSWDFGDGDTSTQKNPENTYWSTTFGSRNFTVTLTVRDQAGSISSATSIIEVITR